MLEVGVAVETRYGFASDEAWLNAKIISVNKDGTFDVKYDSDGSTELRKTTDRIRRSKRKRKGAGPSICEHGRQRSTCKPHAEEP